MPIPLPDLPTGNTTICLVIPDSPEWRQIYMGSLLILQKWWYYDSNNSEDVENIIQRVMDCHYLTSQNYEGCTMVDCEDVADCIESSESVQNAILSLTSIDGFEQTSQVAGQVKVNDLSSGGNPTCDASVWFGGIRELVSRMNRLNVDCLEVFEAATNEIDFLADVVGDITGLDETSVDALLAWIAKLQENIAENYNAQYTTAYEDEISCDLFCLALDACELTPNMIFEYFQERLSASVTWESLFIDVINYLIGGEWSGTQIADFMMLSQVMYRRWFAFFFGGEFFKDLSLALRVGFRSPSTAWVELCEDCPVVWSWDSDYPTSENIWIPRNSLGLDESVWVDGQGFISVDIHPTGVYWRIDAIEATFDPTIVNNISMVYNLTKGSYDTPSLSAVGIFAYSGGAGGTLVASQTLTFTASSNGTDLEISLTVEDEIDYIFVFVRSSVKTTNSYSGACKIVSVHADGDDINPFA